MLDLFNIAKPQNCDIQTFYEVRGTSSAPTASWVKPRGVSNVYMLLIGAGGNGDAGSYSGGGSGAVTVWYGSAQNVPDILYVQIGGGGAGQNTTIIGRFSSGNVQLLRASCASGITAGTATTAGVFAASGFYQSIAGQDGTIGSVTASNTTFLSGGSGSSLSTANYGYSVVNNGIFQTQPIIMGVGAASGGSVFTNKGGIGCGGGPSGAGGPGLVLIASW